MRLAGGAHLTYCTNIHPGESWPDVRKVLDTHVVEVKKRVSPNAPFGVGLRLSAHAAEALASPAALEDLKALLAKHDLYVFTINGFPYGQFHGTRVKEKVYEPDWRADARVAYTDRLATLLAALLPDGVEGSVSTVPGGFSKSVAGDAEKARVAEGLARHAAHLAALRDEAGKVVRLALEPEPWCMLETAADAVAFFERHLFSRADAELLREHVGVCFDACHSAVAFEDPKGALDSLKAAGIRIPKMQVTAALEAPSATARAALKRFADEVYLHQVVERGGDELLRYLDLPDAMARGGAGTWRVHFHVPVFMEAFGALRSTQPHVRALLDLSRGGEVTQHFEVETYTWDVIPEADRPGSAVEAIARELSWVRELLP
jgi:sugar phosphate isomerase/epimerase